MSAQYLRAVIGAASLLIAGEALAAGQSTLSLAQPIFQLAQLDHGNSNGSQNGNNTGGGGSPVLVPLPAAAQAGLATLVGVIGIAAVRRRRLNRA